MMQENIKKYNLSISNDKIGKRKGIGKNILRRGGGLRFGEGLIRKGEESRCGHNFGYGICMDEGATEQANKKLQELQFLMLVPD